MLEGSTGVSLDVSELKHDLRAGVIVFLVALPLCLGVAQTSGAPPLAGLIAGIIGGVLVSLVSGSALSVAGPAAGLAVVILDGVQQIGWRAFLLATLLAGLTQLAIGVTGLGRLVQVVPSSVIRGMLAAIGLILVLKQLPHAFGHDTNPEGDLTFAHGDGQNTLFDLFHAMKSPVLGALLVSVVASVILLVWRNYKGLPLSRWMPREVVAVLAGLVCALVFEGGALAISPEHRVSVPSPSDHGWAAMWTTPDWSAIANWATWKSGFTLAMVASIESLLCLEATDRIDPKRRWSSPDRELLAQGVGNVASSTLGGLPLAAVVVRSSTNVQAGARTRTASFTHGVLLLIATLFLAPVLDLVPLAALAVVLVSVGYKLTMPSLYREMWDKGHAQFWPFVCTVVAILATDIMFGTLVGLVIAVLFFVSTHYRSAVVVTDDGRYRMIRFSASVSFLHKARLKRAFETAPAHGVVVLDGTRARDVDPDVVELITDFEQAAKLRDIELTITRSPAALHDYFRAHEGTTA